MCNADKLILSICLISVPKCASDGGDRSCLFSDPDDFNCLNLNETEEDTVHADADEPQDFHDDSESYANLETSTVHGKQLLELKAKNIS